MMFLYFISNGRGVGVGEGDCDQGIQCCLLNFKNFQIEKKREMLLMF